MKLKYWFKDYFIDPIINILNNIIWFGRQIKSVWKFAKFGWNNYWFDYIYLERLIVWKLEDMAENFEKRGMTLEASNLAKEMREVASDLKYVSEDLENELFEIHHKKFPFVYDIFNDKERERYSEYSQTKEGKKKSADLKKTLEQIEKKQIEIRKKAYIKMAERIKYWWD